MSDEFDALRARLDVHRESGDEWDCVCPLHDDSSPSMRVNPRKRVFYCHGCHRGGTLEMLFSEAFGEAVPRNVVNLNRELDDIETLLEEPARPRVYPESWLSRFDHPHPYWTSRGFTEGSVRFWNLGYDPISDRVTYPLRAPNGDVLGVVYRRLDEGRGPKYQYPSGVNVSHLLFGHHRISSVDTARFRGRARIPVALTEGALDAVALWEAGIPALAQYGSRLSEEQTWLLRRMGQNVFVLFYDDDEAGQRAAEVARERLTWALVEQVSYPEDWRGSDPAGLPRDLAHQMVLDVVS